MANFKFGITKEDKEIEEAKKLREIEKEIQEREKDRRQKLAHLKRVSKRNKAIVLSVFISFLAIMLIFGTYNTFIRRAPTKTEVQKIIASSNNRFDAAGVQGFLMDNMENAFENYVREDGDSDAKLEYYKVDINSIRISKISQINTEVASVDFVMCVESKQQDTKMEDEDDDDNKTVIGESTKKPYLFTVMISKPENKGYRFASEIELRPFKSGDYFKKDEEIEINSYLSFDDIDEVEENKKASAKIKVDRILSDLYENKDISADMEVKRKFNNNGDKYMGISEFNLYTKPNQVGLNSVVKFKVKTSQGLVYNNTMYMKLTPVGKNWKVSAIW